jgi:2',3'-cyclic-nucleotide 2'-phosphodiesterase/3'-nucleotidase
VYTKGVVEAARQFLPGLRAEDVDLVIALSHGGLNVAPYGDRMENANWYLAQEPGIDALLLGHSHAAFPDPDNPKSRFADMPEVDNQRGFVHGKPAVMGGYWGKSLGVIELGLVYRDGRWQIDPAATHSEVRSIRRDDGSFVDPDPEIAALVEDAHQATIAYVSTPIGDSDFPMTTYFAVVGDVSAIQPINMAQRAYAQKYISDNLPDLKDLPILTAAAPFKAGFGGATDFTDVGAGPVAIRGAADLYLYPNTLSVIRINGADLKGWLEKSAGFFNRIDPANPAPQELVNRKTPSYNFDVIQGGVRYAIDISQPLGNRIVDLRYGGQPVAPAQQFLLVTNNYRASGGGDFPGAGESRVLFHAQDMNRSVLIDWIREQSHLQLAQHGSDRPWRFAPLRTAGPVVFHSAAAKLDLARLAGLSGIALREDEGNGMALYSIDLRQ